jgi:xyloglucan-specific endo-beta-1,4-glucanase
MLLSVAFLAGFLATAIATPINERATPTTREVSSVQERVSLCTQYAYYATNGYEVLNNLWGKDQATSGTQCTYVDGTTSNGIAWSTEWAWQGGENNVKSYAYAGRILEKGKLLSNIKSMPTVLNWNYNTTSMRCNVAYDVFTAADPNHVNSSGDYELMIW